MLSKEASIHWVGSGGNRLLGRSWWNIWQWITDPWCRKCGENGRCSLQRGDSMHCSRDTRNALSSLLTNGRGAPHGLAQRHTKSWSMWSENCAFNTLSSAEDIPYSSFSFQSDRPRFGGNPFRTFLKQMSLYSFIIRWTSWDQFFSELSWKFLRLCEVRLRQGCISGHDHFYHWQTQNCSSFVSRQLRYAYFIMSACKLVRVILKLVLVSSRSFWNEEICCWAFASWACCSLYVQPVAWVSGME